MSASSSARNPVERLAEEFASRLRNGELPALSEYTRAYPEHAEEIRELFPTLVAMEQLKPGPGDLTGDFAVAPDDGSPHRLGDYRILREVGRGGMGIVYEAEQESLGRHVALKVLPPSALMSPTYLERFRREAKAAAKLHHTNIVPVFGTGEHENTPFYAMQFIQGEGLDRVLDDVRRLRRGGEAAPAEDGIAHSLLTGQYTLASDPGASSLEGRGEAQPSSSGLTGSSPEAEYCRRVARLGVQAAEALAYAHRQGVLHRDIKPSNLLLDAQGTLWITDFGLAKAEGSDELTNTGDVVGTIRFMAPERFEGKSLPESDIYALGLTLYELLTLRPAFQDPNKAKLIDKVLHEPVPPLRKVNPHVPRDLETVVLKCVAKDPAERYTSADALAEELRRFLADRPIKARRASNLEKVWRWCRRNPTVAALSAALLGILTLTAIVGVAMSLSLEDALGRARKDRDKAQDEELKGKRKLFESLVSDAGATRMSNRSGQRFGSLRRLREALALAEEIGLSGEDRLRMRNIAIAALCLPDQEPGLSWPADRDELIPQEVDSVHRQALLASYAFRRIPPPAYRLHGHRHHSPDGRYLVVGSEFQGSFVAASVRVWRIDLPTPELILEDREGSFEEAKDFSPDSRLVAFGHADGAVTIHDLQARKPVRRLGSGPGPVFCLHFHPRLPRLAVACGSEVAVWNTDSGERLVRMNHPAWVEGVAWHPRGHRLATGARHAIHLWDAETGRAVTAPWKGHFRDGIHLSFNHAGDRVVSNDWSSVSRLWDAATGRLLLSTPGFPILQVGSDDRTLGVYEVENNLRVLDVAGGQEMRQLQRPTASGTESFLDLALHPGGRLLAARTPTGLGFFDLFSGEELAFLAGTFHSGMTFDRNGSLWTGGSAGLVRWPVRSAEGTPGHFRIGPPQWVASVTTDGGWSVSDDGRVVAVPLFRDGTLVVHLGSPRRTVRLGPQYDVRHVNISPNGRWVVSRTHFYGESRFTVWDAKTGKQMARLPTREASDAHGFSTDSRWLYLSGRVERRVEVASLATASPNFAAPQATEVSLWPRGWRSEAALVGGVFSPDDRLRAYGTQEGMIRLVTPDTGEELARLSSPEIGRLTPRFFTPDGRLLLAWGEETQALYVFDLGRIRAQLAELGLDWAESPSLAPVGHDTTPIRVQLIDADSATTRKKMTDHEMGRAIAELYFNPFDAEAHLRLGRNLLDAGKPDPAIAHLTAAIAFGGDLDSAYPLRSLAFARLRRWEEAAADATRYLEKCPFDFQSLWIRADANRLRKRYAEAIRDLTEVLEYSPGSVQLMERRALCYEAVGKADLARAEREKIDKLAAREPTRLNSQAWGLVTGPSRTRDPVKALALIRKALERQPGNLMFVNTLGVVLYRNGKYGEAIAVLEKCLEARNGAHAGYDLFFLAMCHAKLGDVARAKQRLDRAIRWVDEKKDMHPQEIQELRAFRAEAEQVLAGK